LSRLGTLLVILAPFGGSALAVELAPEPMELTPADFKVALPAAADPPRKRGAFAPQVLVPARFTFKPEVEVREGLIALAALATCAGDFSICEEAYAVDLGAAPPPGKQLTLTRRRIADMLRAEWPGIPLELDGAASVRVKAAFDGLEVEAVESRLVERVRELSEAQPDFRIGVDHVSVPKGEKLRPGACRIEFPLLDGLVGRSPDWLARNLAGPKRLEAACIYDDKTQRAHVFTASAHFALQRLLPVSRRDLPRGEAVRVDDFESAWTDVGKEHAGVVEDVEAARGRRLTRPLVVGRPLLWSQLEVPNVVRRGQVVRLDMRRGALDVSFQVKALGSGGYGQLIDAMYMTTRKKLKVRVKDAETVEYAAND
jgi:flagella basal body P-ring formation protein FlgA